MEGKDILHAGKYPLVTVCADNKLITPTKMTASGNQLKLTMSDGGTITLKQKESDVCITLEATNVPDKYEVLLFGPLAVNIHEVVGDVVGVAQGDGPCLRHTSPEHQNECRHSRRIRQTGYRDIRLFM